MPIDVFWDNKEQTICRWVFFGDWNWEDCLAADRYTRTLYDSVDHKVYNILDLTHSGAPPPGMLEHFPRIESMSKGHRNDAQPTIITGVDGFSARLASILVNRYSHFKMTGTLDDAYKLIKKAAHKAPVG